MNEKAPERVFLKACHPASPNHNCTWSISKGPEDAVEYVRADLLATKVKEEREAAFKLTPDEVADLRETLVNAAGDLDTEGLGDTDSCIFARRWAERLKEN